MEAAAVAVPIRCARCRVQAQGGSRDPRCRGAHASRGPGGGRRSASSHGRRRRRCECQSPRLAPGSAVTAGTAAGWKGVRLLRGAQYRHHLAGEYVTQLHACRAGEKSRRRHVACSSDGTTSAAVGGAAGGAAAAVNGGAGAEMRLVGWQIDDLPRRARVQQGRRWDAGGGGGARGSTASLARIVLFELGDGGSAPLRTCRADAHDGALESRRVLGAADNAIHQAHVALLNFHASSQTASGVARKRERHQIPKAKAIHHAGQVRRGALSVA